MTKQVFKNSKNVSREEIKYLKKNIKHSEKNLDNVFKTINFLYSNRGRKISGKLISSAWDKIPKFTKVKVNKLIEDDYFNLRRKEL